MGARAFAVECLMDILTENDSRGQYPKSYYLSTVKEPTKFQVLEENISCDVCVVGGGYTGLSSAIHLAESGYDVVILEAHRVGFGASGRNGGQVCSGQRKNVVSLKKKFGIEEAKKLWTLAEEAKAEVGARVEKHKIDCNYIPGIIQAELKSKYLHECFNEVEQLRTEHSYDKIEYLDHIGIRNYLGTDSYVGGTLDWGAGHLNPLKYVLGLAQGATQNGVRIFETTRVTKINEGSTISIKTENRAVVKAKYLVLGCNGYLGDLDKGIASKVLPINNFIIATEPLEEKFAKSIIRDNVAVSDSKFVVNYFRLTPDNRLLFGGGENYIYLFPSNIERTVKASMVKIFPQLKDTKIEFSWGGTLAVTRSRFPDFSKISENIYSASGYSGQGVAMATMAGRILAEMIRGDSCRFELMANLPTPNFPGGLNLREPIMALSMMWFSLRDKW